jgi:hypothetical protein
VAGGKEANEDPREGIAVKHYETRLVPARNDEYCIKQTCDLCGAEALSPDNWSDHSTWDNLNETEIDVTVRQKNGSSYPEGGSGTKFEVDVCPKCFKEKLVPWLRSQGAQVEEKEWDF